MAFEVQRIGVIGAGQMGAGIAQVAAGAGIEVFLNDVNDELISRGLQGIHHALEKQVQKGKLESAQAEAMRKRLHKACTLADLCQVDLVVEAATEREALKLEIFKGLDQAVDKRAILATNTSSIPITRIAAVTRRPEKVIGMHFMNPVPVMKLVEVIRGLPTSDETTQQTVALAQRLGGSGFIAAFVGG
ncbi:MAG TPA: 3-hydroxyacyl-CoA dehydrogenase NAD-binding domain-containing protein, partial [Myxococcota bacterium]|nr:3-hydroxyacyl-CoA dehydrogenase NAD-binding domain-containing protein [Myxococcota bacterium]